MKRAKSNKYVTTNTIDFLKKNVLNVTDLTRTNKLSEILNQYVGRESEEVYVIQNSKKKNSQAVLIDLDYFEKLLKYKEVIDQAMDDHMYNVALERKDEEATLTLGEVFKDVEFDYDKLIKQIEEEE